MQTIYNQLKTPQPLDQLHQRLNQAGVKWNKSQLQLFLLLDNNIQQTGDLYSAGGNDLDTIILDVVDEVMEGKPVAPISRIMSCMPESVAINVSQEKVVAVAESSGQYELHANGAVLTRTKN